MDAGSLAGLVEHLAEVSHPLGSMAFQSTAIRRNHAHQRPILAYGEDDEASLLGSTNAEDTAEPQDAGMLEGEGGGGGPTEPSSDPADASSAGDDVRMQDGDGSGAGAPPSKPGGRKPIIRSVNLPRWMDLDQETLPNVPPPVLRGRDGAPDTAAATAAGAPAAGGRVLPMSRPRSLGAFGGVGELTVQMHTEAVPYRFSASSAGDGYDALLADFAQRAARRQAAALQPGGTAALAAGATAPHVTAVPAGAARSAGSGAAGGWVAGPARDRAGGRDYRPGTPTEGYVCDRCNVPGHWKHDCKAPPASYTCHNCQGKGHFITDCPKPRPKPAAAGKRARDGAALAGEAASDSGAAGGGDASKRPKVKSMQAMHVPHTGYVCRMCNQPGHWIKDCPLRAREKAVERPPPPEGYVCVKCQQAGHWVELCQLRGHQQKPKPLSAGVEPVTPSAESVEIGTEIAEALEEEGAEPVLQICRVVEVLGEEASRQLLVQAWQVEENGGLLRTDKSEKRRTPGGVFLWLVKQQTTAEQRAMVWPPKATAEAEGAAGRPAAL